MFYLSLEKEATYSVFASPSRKYQNETKHQNDISHQKKRRASLRSREMLEKKRLTLQAIKIAEKARNVRKV
jgi:hypothetical protein